MKSKWHQNDFMKHVYIYLFIHIYNSKIHIQKNIFFFSIYFSIIPYLGQHQNLQFWKCTFSFTKPFLSWFSVDNIFQPLRSYVFFLEWEKLSTIERYHHWWIAFCLMHASGNARVLFFLRHDSMTNLIWASWGMFFLPIWNMIWNSYRTHDFIQPLHMQ